MGAVGPWQLVIVLVLAVFLFGGRGRISAFMGDLARGIRSFRKGLSEDETLPGEEKEQVSAPSRNGDDNGSGRA